MSATKLVIVESPAKAATIEGYLGPDYHVTASIGHIRDLPQPSELPKDMKKLAASQSTWMTASPPTTW